MSRYAEIFDQVGNARAMTQWAPNIPSGTHRVALVKYGPKVSAKDRSVFLEAEFVILRSDQAGVSVGARHSWPWFINKPDEYGYTHARAKDFLTTVQRCVANSEDVKAFGRAITDDFDSDSPKMYGLMLDVAVVPVLDKDGNHRTGKKGTEVLNAVWTAIPQSEGDIAALRAQLTSTKQETATEPAPIARKAAGIGTLLGRVQ